MYMETSNIKQKDFLCTSTSMINKKDRLQREFKFYRKKCKFYRLKKKSVKFTEKSVKFTD